MSELLDLISENIFAMVIAIISVFAANFLLLSSIIRKGESYPILWRLIPSLKNRKATFIFALISWAAVLIVAFTVLTDFIGSSIEHDLPKPQGVIELPNSGDEVSNQFAVQGTLRWIPSNSHVWIMLRQGNQYWPKVEIYPDKEKWFSPVFASNESGDLQIIIAMIDSVDHDLVTNWFKVGSMTSSYSALPKPKSTTLLDSVKVRIRQ